MKTIKIISWFLGITSFMTGFLKFFPPFKIWYSTQIETSGFGSIAYALGIVGEIGVGLAFIAGISWLIRKNLKLGLGLIAINSVVYSVILITAVYVHLLPAVPAEVLPLKIKPPVIPAIFLILGLINLFYSVRLMRTKSVVPGAV